ncbi:hypothetical protein ACET3X_004541 [Alternaria dauci]|uniref:SRR1-like domain-containing protein n=1 Tax=Alternaria dauci TaxID=48095 RepID=A0ABR3UNN2_9PLEO
MNNPQKSVHMSSTSPERISVDLTSGIVDRLQNLSVEEHSSDDGDDSKKTQIFASVDDSDDYDDYEEEEDDDDDDEEEEDLEPVYGYHVDLIAQEHQHNCRPIYTRKLLNDIKSFADRIRKELSVAPDQRQLQSIYAYGLNQNHYRIWQLDNNSRSNYLQVEYLSRVEMHSEFQHRFGKHSDQIKVLRKYNEDHENDCIDTPYTFITFDRQYLNQHRDIAKMREYWAAMTHTRGLWKESSARRKLREDFQGLAKSCAPITQVVCFGLGALNLKKNWYHSAIQHMAVFTIIHTLNEFYRQTEPNRPATKLLLQDPNYKIKDHHILQKLTGDANNVAFVNDPDGLLAIDAGTLVVTAYLPVQMPLVQIIADLFSEDPTQGPAAIICDIMTIDVEKRDYSWSDRSSPATARFLTNHYEKVEDGFDEHGLDDELMEDAYGNDWKENNRFYWLNQMDLWVRKTGTD